MPKSRKNNARKSAEQPSRKSKPAKPRRPAKAALSRGTKVRSASRPACPSKKSAIVALLERPNGAAISDLTKATGWQVHSVRAALTGLRNEGKELVHDKDAAGVTRYRLATAA